jgi:hypothetical protein
VSQSKSGTDPRTIRGTPKAFEAPKTMRLPRSHTPATLTCAFSDHQGAGGDELLGRCLFNLDLVRPVHHYFSGVPREPRLGFVHRTDLLYPQR